MNTRVFVRDQVCYYFKGAWLRSTVARGASDQEIERAGYANVALYLGDPVYAIDTPLGSPYQFRRASELRTEEEHTKIALTQ